MTHRSDRDLAKLLESAHDHLEVGALYRHYKQQNYVVKGLCIIEATSEVGVIYEAQYGSKNTFVRPLSSWLETVGSSGSGVPRFTRIIENSNDR